MTKDEGRTLTEKGQSAIRGHLSRKITAHCADGKSQPEDHEHIRNPQPAGSQA